MDRATTEFDDSPAVNPAIDRELQRWTRVCWAIDPARARLVAANATGLARLGLPAGAHSVPLDPAMPARPVLPMRCTYDSMALGMS